MEKQSFFARIGNWFKKEIFEFRLLLESLPSIIVALFVISVISMNLLANKTLVQVEYLAVDGGILVSWLSFLCMDVVTKHFGPKAATRLCIVAIFINIVVAGIFVLVSIMPGIWGAASEAGDSANIAVNATFRGTWFILLSSTIAFFSSALINNFLNYAIGKMFKKNPDGKLAFFVRSYVSTFIGQFFDNLIFAILAFVVFSPIFWGFGWTFVQCVMCSLLGAGLELLFEIVFSPFGFLIAKSWKKRNVGEKYLTYINEKENEKCAS